MTFTCSRSSLVNELSLLRTVARPKGVIPILSNVLLGMVGDTLTLTATDMDVSIITEIQASGNSWGGCVNCQQLYDLARLMDGDELTFTVKDNGWLQVGKGKSKHLLITSKLADYPNVEREEADGVTIDAPTFNRMLDHVSFAVMEPSDNVKGSQQRFTGISLTMKDNKLRLDATNILRWATVTCPLASPVEFQVIIPRQAIGPLSGMDKGTLTIDASPNHAHFTNGARHLYTRLLDDRFPDWQSIFPAEYEHAAEIASDALGNAIRRAMLTANESKFIKDGLRWTLGGDELLIETRGGDKGKSDEVVGIACPSLNGSQVVLGMNGGQVVDALPRLGEKLTCRFNDKGSIVELTPPESDIAFAYYINTVSLRNWGT